MTDIDTLKEFLNLPLGQTDGIFAKFAGIPGAVHRGSGPEQFVFIEGRRANRVLLVAHADTYWDRNYRRSSAPQELYEVDGIIRNRTGGLGADDRAGCAIVWLLREMGHSILITDGEERGQLASRSLMEKHPDIADAINHDHQFVLQFDRRNGSEFKCYSVGTDLFRAYVTEMTGYSEPDRAFSTDIVKLCRNICGVNLSIGYNNEHTADEYLVVADWLNTLNICRKWLTENELPRFGLDETEKF